MTGGTPEWPSDEVDIVSSDIVGAIQDLQQYIFVVKFSGLFYTSVTLHIADDNGCT